MVKVTWLIQKYENSYVIYFQISPRAYPSKRVPRRVAKFILNANRFETSFVPSAPRVELLETTVALSAPMTKKKIRGGQEVRAQAVIQKILRTFWGVSQLFLALYSPWLWLPSYGRPSSFLSANKSCRSTKFPRSWYSIKAPHSERRSHGAKHWENAPFRTLSSVRRSSELISRYFFF